MAEIKNTAAEMINHLTEVAHETAIEHGFYDDQQHLMNSMRVEGMFEETFLVGRSFTLEQIAKIMSECGEAVAAIQHGEADDFVAEELADAVIRTFDLAGYMGVDFGSILVSKMERNKHRPYKHGKVC